MPKEDFSQRQLSGRTKSGQYLVRWENQMWLVPESVKAEGSYGRRYFRCNKRSDNKSCEGAGTLRIPDTEAVIYAAMIKKLKPFQTIKGRKNALKSNPKLTTLQVELAQVQHEIETLIDTLT